ncbi:MAG: hypothetical protein JW927_10650 [Deltaproteobacteria bacterium]|nr:hypothetical protein [Deltaproteobacteria bacterium]
MMTINVGADPCVCPAMKVHIYETGRTRRSTPTGFNRTNGCPFARVG